MWIKCSESSEEGESPGWGGGEHFTGEVALKLVLKKRKDSQISVWGWGAVRRRHLQKSSWGEGCVRAGQGALGLRVKEAKLARGTCISHASAHWVSPSLGQVTAPVSGDLSGEHRPWMSSWLEPVEPQKRPGLGFSRGRPGP